MLSTFEVVAEPRRRQILDLLCAEERSVNELVAALGMAQPAVSKHLRVLKAARLVDVEVDAQRRVYRLRAAPLRELETWLAPYRRYWSDRLDALETHLDRMPDGPASKHRKPKRSRR
ncbi:MAG: metalloregulator ArsR/SmtB family transcription factor [Polyangiales bacterium]